MMNIWLYAFLSVWCVGCEALVDLGAGKVGTPSAGRTTKLHLFNWGKSSKESSNPGPVPVTAKKIDEKRLQELKQGLEKISNTQNRDYEAEARARAPPPPEIKDKQITSFNFNRANEFPNLYKGWIRNEGDQIAKQMIASTKSALSKKVRLLEVLFDPVPNLDEVAFGTEWNKKHRQDITTSLKVPDFAANRGGPATLEWANLYWANRLAPALVSGRQKVIAITLSGEGLKGKYPPTFVPSLSLISLSEAKAAAFEAKCKNEGVGALILLSPCQESHYKDGKALSDKLNIPLVALNSPYSFKYDVGKFITCAETLFWVIPRSYE